MPTRIIALPANNGSGKTSIAAPLVKKLVAGGQRVLVVDAVPMGTQATSSLAEALGVQPHETIQNLRQRVVQALDDNKPSQALSILSCAKRAIMLALIEEGFAYIAMGSVGCHDIHANALVRDLVTMLGEGLDCVVLERGETHAPLHKNNANELMC